MIERQTLTVAEVARALGITHPTVYSQIHAGRLRSFKIGRRRFITRQALNEFIALMERETSEAA